MILSDNGNARSSRDRYEDLHAKN